MEKRRLYFYICRDIEELSNRIQTEYSINLRDLLLYGLSIVLKEPEKLINNLVTCKQSEAHKHGIFLTPKIETIFRAYASSYGTTVLSVYNTLIYLACRELYERYRKEKNIEKLREEVRNRVREVLSFIDTASIEDLKQGKLAPLVLENYQTGRGSVSVILPLPVQVEKTVEKTVEKVIYRIPRLEQLEQWYHETRSLQLDDYATGQVFYKMLDIARRYIPRLVKWSRHSLVETFFLTLPFTRQVLDIELRDLLDMVNTVLGDYELYSKVKPHIESTVGISYLLTTLTQLEKLGLEISEDTLLGKILKEYKELGTITLVVDPYENIKRRILHSLDTVRLGYCRQVLQYVSNIGGQETVTYLKHAVIRALLLDLLLLRYRPLEKYLETSPVTSRKTLEKLGDRALLYYYVYTILRPVTSRGKLIIDPSLHLGTVLPSLVDLWRLPPHLEAVYLFYMMELAVQGAVTDNVLSDLLED